MTPQIWEAFNKIADYLVPVISVIASYFFGRLQSNNSSKYNAMKERYEKFYVPFIRFFYMNQLQSLKFSALPPEIQGKIYRLFLDNIQYLDLDTMYSLDPLMYQLSLLFLKRSGSELEQVTFAEENLDGIFKETTESILVQAKALAKKIHLLAEYFQNGVHKVPLRPPSAGFLFDLPSSGAGRSPPARRLFAEPFRLS